MRNRTGLKFDMEAPCPTSSRSTRQDWDLYWEEYESPNYVNYTPHLISTIKRRIDLRGCRVLEVGAGTGGNSCTLASIGADVTAADFSASSLNRTLGTATTSKVDLTVVQADARHLPFASGSFDLVFHQGFLEHFVDPGALVREQRRILKEGGHILVDVPQRYNWYTIYKHRFIRAGKWPYGAWEREFSLRELKLLLKREGFQIIDAYGRGYFPRWMAILNELEKMESRVLKRRILPAAVWRSYRRFWDYFERTAPGCYVLQSIGVLGKAISDL